MQQEFGRFLRDPVLRDALYEGADGKCQQCGKPLEIGWHADHVVPWSVVGRTNVFEMQALCRTCNLSKGAKLMQYGLAPKLPTEFNIDIGQFRPGQRQAYNVTVDRVSHGERYTAIVLPTRYGKSDYMRITGLRLLRDGLVSAVLIIAPDRVLRNQVLDEGKTEHCWRFYGVQPSIRETITTDIIEDSPQMWRVRGSHFIAATTSMVAGRQRPFFEAWVSDMKRRWGVYPMVFVDEAHTGSDENTWGAAMNALAQAGAFIGLCTATPFRSDGRPIPGFQVDPIDETIITRNERIGDYQRSFAATSTTYRLRAHHVTTFREAWAENPSPICKVSHQTFEVFLKEYYSGDDARLSRLSEREVRQVLRTELRKRHIIRQACELFVRDIRNRRREAPSSAGIIFVGNDETFDKETEVEADFHAHAVDDVLKDLAPELRVKIVTSNVDEPLAAIEAFAQGEYDVMIAKQMAGRGLDIDRLKTELDLSYVRTRAAFIQRLMRIATRWEREGRMPVRHCTYIGPDDPLSLDLYRGLVTDQGGGVDQRMIGTWEEINGENGPGNGNGGYEPSLKEYEAMGIGPGEALRDSDEVEAPGDVIDYVDELYEKHKEFTTFLGKGELGQAIAGMAKSYANDTAPDHTQPEETEQPQRQHKNIGEENRLLRKEVNDLAHQLTQRMLKLSGPTWTQEAFEAEIQETWGHHKRKVSLSPATPLKEIPNDKLQEMVRNMDEEWHND